MRKIYVAGPMSGYPNFNFKAFHNAAKTLREAGWEVFNPAEADISRHGGVDISEGNEAGCPDQAKREHGFDRNVALAADLNFILLEADAIAMLPGWEKSKGAIIERRAAMFRGIEVIYL